jgi:hypothetical protein
MKTRMLVSILILVLVVLVITGSCTTGKKAVKAPIESVYGIWVNLDYNTVTYENARHNIRPDGIIEIAPHSEIEYQKYTEVTFTIVDRWMDSDGSKYYKVDIVQGTVDWHELWRINETDSVYELVRSNIDYPSEIDPNHFNYRIYYRQE